MFYIVAVKYLLLFKDFSMRKLLVAGNFFEMEPFVTINQCILKWTVPGSVSDQRFHSSYEVIISMNWQVKSS